VNPIVKLAKDTVEKYVQEGKILSTPSKVPPEMREEAGVFVSIKKGGDLRGCIGTFSPTTENIAAEVIRNAVHAATMDPRFSPVKPSELDDLDYSVDILSPPEKIEDTDRLDPKKYGVIVEKGGLRGLLLPDLEGVETVEEQLRIAALKAGISSVTEAQLYRFKVKRYR
jgi:AmmeMemoRadiSam system protein A